MFQSPAGLVHYKPGGMKKPAGWGLVRGKRNPPGAHRREAWRVLLVGADERLCCQHRSVPDLNRLYQACGAQRYAIRLPGCYPSTPPLRCWPPSFRGVMSFCRPATYHGIEPPPFLPSLDKRAGIEPALSLLVACADLRLRASVNAPGSAPPYPGTLQSPAFLRGRFTNIEPLCYASRI